MVNALSGERGPPYEAGPKLVGSTGRNELFRLFQLRVVRCQSSYVQ